MAGGGSTVFMILRKANFFRQQGNIFYLTIKFVENIENGNPISSPIKVIINPTS